MRNGKNPGIVHLLPGYTVTAKILFFEDASKYAMVIPSLIDITGLGMN
jgi:hypothetical protein